MDKYMLFFAFLLTSISFSQSPWTKNKGEAYTQISYTTIGNYDTQFGDPEYNTLRKITDNTLQLYGELGLSNSTTLILNLPFKLVKTGDLTANAQPNPAVPNSFAISKESKTALGNIEIGIKHNFYKKDWVLSGQLSVETSSGSFDANSGLRTGYDAWSFTPLFLAGKSFNKSYVQTFIGANIRTNNYSSNFKIGGEYGRKISKNIWLIGFVDIVKSFKNGSVALPFSNLSTGLYINNQEYGAFGFKGIGEISNKFGITAGYGGAFFGNNVPKKGALTFGLYQKF